MTNGKRENVQHRESGQHGGGSQIQVIEPLVQEYDLTEKEIVDDLFEHYWERGHYLKYDETKGSLNNWIAHYVDLYLNHLIR